jgi:hypothetical protein
MILGFRRKRSYMLNLEELFKKRPFIYYIGGDYYAFGSGVCAKCNNNGKRYPTLPGKYENYVTVKDKDISQKEAWEIYHKLWFVADAVKDDENNYNLKEQFENLQFTEKEKEEVERQLSELVDFFRRNHLVDYYVSVR